MSVYILRYAALFSSCLLVLSAVQAQIQPVPKWEAGIYGGVYMYQGDLTPHRLGSIETIKPGWGLQVTRIVSPSFSASLGFSFAKLKGDEALYGRPVYRQQRAFAFTTPVKELSLLIQYSLLKSNYDNRRFEPYVFTGGSLSFVNISRDYSRLNTTVFPDNSDVQLGLNEDIAKKLPKVLPSIPAGIGLRFNLTERFTVNTATTYRFMYTDYLDGFSKSASPKFKDHYLSQTIGLIYKFGKKASDMYKCPSY